MRTVPIHLGKGPQLFVDNHVIELVNFVTRTMHQPVKQVFNPVWKKDRPWEQVPFIRTNTWNVHWDEQEKIYKFWCEDLAWDYDEFMRLQGEGKGKAKREVAGIESFEKTIDNRLLYAESSDGIHWEKPEMDYRIVDGRRTSICFGNEQDGKIHACSILLDPFETDRSRRYKAIYWNSKHGLADSRIAVAFSRDGRRWAPCEERIRVGQISDRLLGDVIILTADATTGEYNLDTRGRAMQEPPTNPKHPTVTGWGPAYYPGDPIRMSKRRIFTSVSRDILNWPVLREMLATDDVEDNLDDEYYGLVRFRIGDLHLGLLNVFARTHNMLSVHLVHSRDGYNWNRVCRGKPFLETGPPGAWDCYMAETCNVPLFLDDEIRVYYAGSNFHHDWWMFGEQEGLDVPEAHPGWNGGETALGLATLRPEGFVSLDTTVREGVLGTHVFVSDGEHLVVNAACGPKGCLDVEIADANDDVIRGFERSACDTFDGDSTAHVVTWNGKADLPRETIATGCKLRFYSQRCSLYSFNIVDEPRS